MEHPRIDDLRTCRLAGSGPCGSVYEARDAADRVWAFKVFHGEAINRRLLAETTHLLESAGWPRGVMPIVAADYHGWPPRRATPWLTEPGDEGRDVPRNLQSGLDRFPSDESWQVLRDLAESLATFHSHGVAHGNLKPGNVFFDPDNRVVLTDWALGNMPGVRHIDYTDAYLYQSPEQLRDPGGYHHGAGFRWDVFSFGVLAFWLLTGRFPRCHDTFARLLPRNGDNVGGIHTDVERVARRLEEHAGVQWPVEPRNDGEAGWHGWITRCLAIDPASRPATMMEVARGFASIDEHARAEETCDALLDQRRKAQRQARSAKVTATLATMATVAAAVIGTRAWMTSDQLRRDREAGFEREQQASLGAAEEIAAVKAARDEAVAKEAAARQERDQAVARLAGSQAVGERLFEWAMEQDHRQLPPLDGREARLKVLERHLEPLLAETERSPALAGERANVQLALAEIALSRGDAARAGHYLDRLADAGKDRQQEADWRLRIATDRLRLALLKQEAGDPATSEAFAFARQALEGVAKTDADKDRLDQLLAVLDFREAQLLAARGEEAKALEQSMRATQALNRLAERRPDVALVRSAMADSYLSAAAILEGMGSFGDAREVRIQATGLLVKLVEQNPRDIGLRLELAGCYGGIAEVALRAGDAPSADLQNSRATALLEAVLQEQPEQKDALLRLGMQRGIRAALLRDQGQTEEAVKMLDDGIRLLDSVRTSGGSKAAAFQLALLQWQKGRMAGATEESRTQALGWLLQARDALRSIESSPASAEVNPEQVHRSLAYLLGDLGTAQFMAKKPEEAKRSFLEAVAMWERLNQARPKSGEYAEGLSWCKQRLQELQ